MKKRGNILYITHTLIIDLKKTLLTYKYMTVVVVMQSVT